MAQAIPKRLGYAPGVLAQVSVAMSALAANRAATRLRNGPDADRERCDVRSADRLFATIARPSYAKRIAGEDERSALWNELFAWQRLAGANPHVIARIDDVRSFDDRVAQTDEGASFVRACAEGRAFVADLRPFLTGLSTGENKRCHPCAAAFVVDSSGGPLRPVAISLQRSRGDSSLVTPSDPAWTRARRAFQCADANVQETYYHLGRAHFVTQAFAMATERQLSERHPLYPLLAAHTHGTLAINQSARDELILPGNKLDALMAPTLDASLSLVRRAVHEWSPSLHDLREDLARRGVDAPTIAQYPYRDDALLVRSAIDELCLDFVCVVYESDGELQSDSELRAWLDELRSNDGGRLSALPSTLDRREALAALLAAVIFNASAFHSSVNYSQFDAMGWAPNAATALEDDDEWPTLARAEEQLSFMYQQSQIRDNRLGDYGPKRFADPRLAPILARFRAALDEASASIEARQSTRLVEYPYLDPATLPASIHI